MWRQMPGIRWLLLGGNTVVLAVTLLAFVALRMYDSYLVRQTERQLIAESVAIAEMYRQLWLEESGLREPADYRPPWRIDDTYVPIEPVINITHGLEPPQSGTLRTASAVDTPALRAGQRIEPILRRTQTFNLSALRVLDGDGCVVATTRGEAGLCLESLPEVQQALAGEYSAVARERLSDEPLPPLSDIRRRGSVRIFTALPVFSEGHVIAVVRGSRTSLDAFTSLWQSRRGLLVLTVATMLLAVITSLVFAAIIARPLRALASRAQAIARGDRTVEALSPHWAPAEIKSVAGAIEKLLRELRGRAEYVAQFAANVSHELKTPITGIRGATELLRDSWHEMRDEQRQRFLANIDADAERMERLVTRLLQLARIENAPEPTARTEVAPVLHELAARYGEAVRLELVDPPAALLIDRDHLLSVAGNLLDNAVRYRAQKPVRLRAGAAPGERLRLEVRDEGPGISEANQRRLFERFFTTERDRGGTGLGLAIVKAVADRRGGQVSFTTGPEGTTFTVVL